MMGDITQPEYRQILVEMLCILATIMERNPEISFSDTLNCDQVWAWSICLSSLVFQLCQQAFQFFCADNNVSDKKDMTPFYQLDESHTSDIYSLITSSGTNTTSYLLRVGFEYPQPPCPYPKKVFKIFKGRLCDQFLGRGKKISVTLSVSSKVLIPICNFPILPSAFS